MNTMAPSTKCSQKISVKTLYKSSRVKAFSVHIPEGKYLVLDYKDRRSKTPDTEVYTEEYLREVRFHTPEYKAANQAVSNYILDKSYEDDYI
jgi:hypothetical protein